MNVQDIINRRDKEVETAARWAFAADGGDKAFEYFLTKDRIVTIDAIVEHIQKEVHKSYMKLKKAESKKYKCDKCGNYKIHKDMYKDNICYLCWDEEELT